MKRMIVSALAGAAALLLAGAVQAQPRGGPDWQSLGQAQFSYKTGDTTVDGAAGRRIRRIGLRPRRGDAQCTRMVIRFSNGERGTFAVNGGRVMRERTMYQVDLPGRRSNIARLALSCHAVRGPRVAIEVLGMR
jgi:hypothetical protein